jgi:pentapeptide MXKDX repeat protein
LLTILKESSVNKLKTMMLAGCLAMAAGSVLAQDAMKPHEMAKGGMGKKDEMKKEMSKDGMKKDAMGKMEKKGDMAHDTSKMEKKGGMDNMHKMEKMEKKGGMMKDEMKK